jgi:hypothetical protein
VFEFATGPGLTITLRALRDGQVVGSSTVTTLSGFTVHHYTLSVSGAPFDTLHLSVGPTDQDAVFASVDNVTVGGGCRVDFDSSGQVNVQDFLAFLQAYSQGDASADFDQSGAVNVQDFLVFLAAFSAGCP